MENVPIVTVDAPAVIRPRRSSTSSLLSDRAGTVTGSVSSSSHVERPSLDSLACVSPWRSSENLTGSPTHALRGKRESSQAFIDSFSSTHSSVLPPNSISSQNTTNDGGSDPAVTFHRLSRLARSLTHESSEPEVPDSACAIYGPGTVMSAEHSHHNRSGPPCAWADFVELAPRDTSNSGEEYAALRAIAIFVFSAASQSTLCPLKDRWHRLQKYSRTCTGKDLVNLLVVSGATWNRAEAIHLTMALLNASLLGRCGGGSKTFKDSSSSLYRFTSSSVGPRLSKRSKSHRSTSNDLLGLHNGSTSGGGAGGGGGGGAGSGVGGTAASATAAGGGGSGPSTNAAASASGGSGNGSGTGSGIRLAASVSISAMSDGVGGPGSGAGGNSMGGGGSGDDDRDDEGGGTVDDSEDEDANTPLVVDASDVVTLSPHLPSPSSRYNKRSRRRPTTTHESPITSTNPTTVSSTLLGLLSPQSLNKNRVASPSSSSSQVNAVADMSKWEFTLRLMSGAKGTANSSSTDLVSSDQPDSSDTPTAPASSQHATKTSVISPAAPGVSSTAAITQASRTGSIVSESTSSSSTPNSSIVLPRLRHFGGASLLLTSDMDLLLPNVVLDNAKAVVNRRRALSLTDVSSPDDSATTITSAVPSTIAPHDPDEVYWQADPVASGIDQLREWGVCVSDGFVLEHLGSAHLLYRRHFYARDHAVFFADDANGDPCVLTVRVSASHADRFLIILRHADETVSVTASRDLLTVVNTELKLIRGRAITASGTTLNRRSAITGSNSHTPVASPPSTSLSAASSRATSRATSPNNNGKNAKHKNSNNSNDSNADNVSPSSQLQSVTRVRSLLTTPSNTMPVLSLGGLSDKSPLSPLPSAHSQDKLLITLSPPPQHGRATSHEPPSLQLQSQPRPHHHYQQQQQQQQQLQHNHHRHQIQPPHDSCPVSDDPDFDERLSLEHPRALVTAALHLTAPQLNVPKMHQCPSTAVMDQLLEFDEMSLSRTYKFGVIYVGKGQTTEREWLTNKHHSSTFDDFLHMLGSRVSLDSFKGYQGGLLSTDGPSSVYTRFCQREIMFHVSTLLPFDPNDTQQINRKRHIGNDVVCFVYLEDDTPFSPTEVRSGFIHAYIVIRAFPQSSGSPARYTVTTLRRNTVPPSGPVAPKTEFDHGQSLRNYLLTKAINMEHASHMSVKLSELKTRRRRLLLRMLLRGFSSARLSTAEIHPLSQSPYSANNVDSSPVSPSTGKKRVTLMDATTSSLSVSHSQLNISQSPSHVDAVRQQPLNGKGTSPWSSGTSIHQVGRQGSRSSSGFTLTSASNIPLDSIDPTLLKPSVSLDALASVGDTSTSVSTSVPPRRITIANVSSSSIEVETSSENTDDTTGGESVANVATLLTLPSTDLVRIILDLRQHVCSLKQSLCELEAASNTSDSLV